MAKISWHGINGGSISYRDQSAGVAYDMKNIAAL